MDRRRAVIDRRRFVGLGAASLVAGALPRRASWAGTGADVAPLRLVFFSDVHARTEWGTPEALEMAAAAINRQRPELIVAGGDLITEGFESSVAQAAPRWKVYRAMHDALAAPVVAAIGNHDLVAAAPADGSEPAADPRSVFLAAFGLERSYRSLDVAGYHLVLLDAISVTGGEEPYLCRVDDAQLAWLDSDLAKVGPQTPVILVSHVPLLTAFYQATGGATTAAPANRVVTNNLQVLERFASHRLVAVLQSHLHVNEMLRWGATTFITGGAICGKWWRGSWHGTAEGFGVLTLARDRVDWEYLGYGWTARRP